MAGWRTLPAVVSMATLLWVPVASAVPPPKLPPGHKAAKSDALGGLKLERTRVGGFRHRDRVHGFEATIHRDGSVTFREIPRVQVKTNLAPDDAQTAAGLLRGSYAPQPTLQQESGNHLIDPKHMPYGQAPILLSVGGSVGGIADMLTHGQRTAAKQKFLKDTEDLRDRLARSATRRNVHKALAGLRLHLVAAWNDKSRTLGQKRALLFRLWDEAAERAPIESREGVSLGSAAPTTRAAEHNRRHREAGERARRTIEAFVRAVAPKGSSQAYSAEELARFNATRRSRQRFEPYVK